MPHLRVVLFVCLLFTAHLASPAHAQQATPGPWFALDDGMSPVALYDLLLATPFPNDLLPPGVAPLSPYEWLDSNDADLAGAIGGVIFADGDPFASDLPTAMTYVVYPDTTGPRAQFANALRAGAPFELAIAGQVVPAARADVAGAIAIFTVIDNVLLYGMAPAGADAEDVAVSLTAAGAAHLLHIAGSGDAAAATPVSSSTRDGEGAFLALAASPFPQAEIPFAIGSLVVLPMSVSRAESASGLVKALLVRDADRTYPYPLLFYRFYADEATASNAMAAAMQSAAASAAGELPPDIQMPYPLTLIDRTNDTTEILVQVGATIVVGNAATGDANERHETAMRLAQIGVKHLEMVAESRTSTSGEG